MAKRTHPLVVRIDRALFDAVREMIIATDDGSRQRRCGGEVPWGAWSDLLETILRDWLSAQERRRTNTQHAKEFARNGH